MRLSVLTLVGLLLTPVLRAQADPAFGDCALGTAQVDLREANVRARMFNTGGFFWKGGNAEYEVPKGSGLTSIFAAGLWMAGTIDGEIRATWADYGDWEWRPGPLGPGGSAPSVASCEAADRIWRVTVGDVAAYNAGGAPTDDLAEWPVALGAPVVDGDGVAGNYDLAAGDRPAILGGETAWWVMNDRGAEHLNADTLPLGLELRVTAFAFPRSYTARRFSAGGGAFAAQMARMTFYRFEITNGNATDAIDDLSVTWWSDVDLGDYQDDYVGSSPERDLAFAYNSDDDDAVSAAGYGDRPPAIGNVFLSDPMTGFMYYNSASNPVNGNPSNGQQVYNFTHGLWRDGSLQTYGADGTNQNNPPWPFFFSDPPPGFWSEYDASDAPGEQPNVPDDRRYVSYTTRDRLGPGETWTLDKAVVWAQTDAAGPGAAFRSLDLLFSDVDRIQGIYEAVGLFAPDPSLRTVLPAGSEDEPELPDALGLGQRPRPHPVTASSVLDVAVPDGVRASVEVFDALGRRVAELPLRAGQETVALGALDLAPGAYLARIAADGQVGSRIVQFIVAR